VALCAWAVAAVVVGAPASAWWAAAVFAVASAVLLARGTLGSRRWVALAAVACAAGGAVCAQAALAQPGRAAAVAAVESGYAEITGTVTTKVEPRGEELSFMIDTSLIDGAGRGAAEVRVPARVRVSPAAVNGGVLDLGSRVVVAGRVVPADAGDAEAVMLFAKKLTVERAPPHALGVASALREAFVERASELPGAGGELLPGLSVGDTRLVSTELDSAMKASSLSHLTAVSGPNC